MNLANALAHLTLMGESDTSIGRYTPASPAVPDGMLAPGARLPSARSGCSSRSPADCRDRLSMLAGEGYIVTRGAVTLVDPALTPNCCAHRRAAAGIFRMRPRRVSPRRVNLLSMGLPFWSRWVAWHALVRRLVLSISRLPGMRRCVRRSPDTWP
jgi:hypothetical protein